MIMKLSAIILLSTCLTASAKGTSQITISKSNAPLQKVFKEIKRQSGYNFLYRYELLEDAGPVTVNLSNATLNQALDAVLKGKRLTYEIIDNTVVIKVKERVVEKEEIPLPEKAVERVVKGKVTNETGASLEGVSVVLKGTQFGTTTDKNGNYSINIPDNGVLIFSIVDFTPFEIEVGQKASVDVKLKAAQNELEQVVVVGYGTQKKKDVTGSISRISGSSIKDVPVQGFDQALSGRAAGVNVTIPNGILGNPPVIRVRGINSISLSSFPLIVVDGIPTWSGDVGGFAQNNALADINPSDIESFEILKDANFLRNFIPQQLPV